MSTFMIQMAQYNSTQLVVSVFCDFRNGFDRLNVWICLVRRLCQVSGMNFISIGRNVAQAEIFLTTLAGPYLALFDFWSP